MTEAEKAYNKLMDLDRDLRILLTTYNGCAAGLKFEFNKFLKDPKLEAVTVLQGLTQQYATLAKNILKTEAELAECRKLVYG